jgi:hypothetical protein
VTARLGYTGTLNDGGNDHAGTDALVVFGPFTTDATNVQIVSAELYVYDLQGSGTRSQKVRLVLFPDASGAPSLTPVVTSNEQTVDQTTATGAYVQFTVPATNLAPSTSYWIGVWWGTQVNSAQIGMFASYAGSAPGVQRYNLSVTYASTGNPTVSSWSTGDNRFYRADFLLQPADWVIVQITHCSSSLPCSDGLPCRSGATATGQAIPVATAATVARQAGKTLASSAVVSSATVATVKAKLQALTTTAVTTAATVGAVKVPAVTATVSDQGIAQLVAAVAGGVGE